MFTRIMTATALLALMPVLGRCLTNNKLTHVAVRHHRHLQAHQHQGTHHGHQMSMRCDTNSSYSEYKSSWNGLDFPAHLNRVMKHPVNEESKKLTGQTYCSGGNNDSLIR